MINLDTKKIDRSLKGKSLIDIPSTFVVFDIETTGLDSSYDEIIEISAIKVNNDKVVDKFSSLVKPSVVIDDYIVELTGITNEMVSEAPNIKEVLPKFMDFIGDNILVGHNVNFDINFIYDYLCKNGFLVLTNDFVDTMRIARRILPELAHHRLIDLAKYFRIDSSGNHRALRDTEITLEVFYSLKELIIKRHDNIETFKDSYKHFNSFVSARRIVTSKTIFDEDNEFYKKHVAITGTLEKMTRKEAMQVIVDLGGYVEDSVTNKTNYLILGNNDYNPILRGRKSSKLKKAEKLKLEGKDIEIISENVFYDLVLEETESNK